MSASRKVLNRIRTAPDQELHLSRIRVNNLESIELRKYVPSLKRYGRGVILDKDIFVRLVREEGPDIIERLWPKGAPGPGQGALRV